MDRIILSVVLVVITVINCYFCYMTKQNIINLYKIYNNKITLLHDDLDELRKKIKKLEQEISPIGPEKEQNMEEQ